MREGRKAPTCHSQRHYKVVDFLAPTTQEGLGVFWQNLPAPEVLSPEDTDDDKDVAQEGQQDDQ